MGFEQYTGCLIQYHNRIACVTGAESNYEGEWLYLQYIGKDTSFSVNVFEEHILSALPDPQNGLLKRRNKDVVFSYKGTEYELSDQPYEPCLYLKKEGILVCTLHNAFTSDDLPEWFAEGKTLTAMNGKTYDLGSFCKVLAAAIDSNRSEMDFTFAAKLVNEQ